MRLNESTGELILNNKRYHLTRTETKILQVLELNKIITYEAIYYAIYKIKINKIRIEDKKAISTMVCRLRKKTGLQIKVFNEYGYMLGGTNG